MVDFSGLEKRCRSEFSLHKLASQGEETIVRTCIEEGYPLNGKDRFGRTALHQCVESYRNCFDNQGARILACISLLLEGGADPSIEDGQKRTVLDGAILQNVTFYNAEFPNVDNLYYSPYGLDKHSANIKMGKLLQLLYNTEFANTDVSWLITYARQHIQPIDVLQILDNIFISSRRLLRIILLRTLMHEGGQLNSYVLTATKHGKQTGLNLHSIEQVSSIASLLMHIYELLSEINRIKRLLKFENMSNPELSVMICEHFEEISKREKCVPLHLRQIFKTLKEFIYTKDKLNYLTILLSARNSNYVRLADLKPNFLSYLKGRSCRQEHLIEVFGFIVEWIENRPEDRESGEELREDIVNKFNASCSLHYLIERDLTDLNCVKLKLKLVDFLINQALNAYGSHRTALHLAAATCDVNMLRYLVYEKDVYLYAINDSSHTFYDVLIDLYMPESRNMMKSSRQKLINDLANVMLLKPLKTLCAEKIVRKISFLNNARNKLGGCTKLMQLFRLHSSS